MQEFKHLQQYLFKTALSEHGLDCPFSYNHRLGTHSVGKLTFGIKFPRSYVNAISLLSHEKKYDYCFIGYMHPGLGRNEMLAPFQTPNSIIRNSNYGRDQSTKFVFTEDYYQDFANSKFGLCPIHQGGEWYIHDWAWSYRVIETVLCKSVPIAFRETPYGQNFIKDIQYLWNDESHEIANYNKIVEDNYCLGLQYWTLQPDEVAQIKKELQ